MLFRSNPKTPKPRKTILHSTYESIVIDELSLLLRERAIYFLASSTFGLSFSLLSGFFSSTFFSPVVAGVAAGAAGAGIGTGAGAEAGASSFLSAITGAITSLLSSPNFKCLLNSRDLLKLSLKLLSTSVFY